MYERVDLVAKAVTREAVMGYYVHISHCDWEIRETAEALATVREMPKKYHAIKRGGSSNGERWFSWMNDAEIENAESVQHVFVQLGFETEKTDEGFAIHGYNSKTGQEDLFLAVMAPFTKEGSWMEWEGEDHEFWRFSVINGRMVVEDGDKSYSEARPYTYHHLTLVPHPDNDKILSGMRTLDVDPLGSDLQEQLATAESWEQEKEAYYADIRERQKSPADS